MLRRTRTGLLKVGGASAGLLLLVALMTGAAAPGPNEGPVAGEGEAVPTLVVLLIVDQLRGDMLDRYGSLFTGGFKRLMEEGLFFTNALHDHAQTETSPGHAAISTGVYPSRAGIPSNAWREEGDDGLLTIYNVLDPSVSLAGFPELPGSSPAVLRRGGLADWIQDADEDAKVVSVSAKDRGAILLAGQSKGEVYWFDSQVGRFVTSTYYRSRNPSWLNRFNGEGLAEFMKDSVWVSTVPPEAESMSAPDTASFEGNGINTYFPHRFVDEVADPGPGDYNFWFELTPWLDEATLEVALLALDNEDLGKKEGRTDFLSISFSQVDRVGHEYGPLSREQLDNLLRLDKTLDKLLAALDREIGRENYVLGFTSDHGIMNMPERIDEGGRRLSETDRSRLEQSLSSAARQSNFRREVTAAEAMIEALEEMDFVGPSYTHDQLEAGVTGDPLADLFQHSYTPGRAGGLLSIYGIEMWWKENILPWRMPVGTTHGSPYRYDRWVPLILMGPGIGPGIEDREVSPMDLAPTLAQLAGIPFPDDLNGEPLLPKGNER